MSYSLINMLVWMHLTCFIHVWDAAGDAGPPAVTARAQLAGRAGAKLRSPSALQMAPGLCPMAEHGWHL